MNDFFGSKLNTVLLLALIVLMVFALKFMYKNQETYVDPLIGKEEQKEEPKTEVPEITGNKGDLVSFSVKPGQKVSGVLKFSGSVKNAYFFEANIGINILDKNNKLLKAGNAMATTDWMTSEPVAFEGSINLAGLPKGPAYLQIANDNASGLPENDKFILIPIVIE